GGVVDEQRRLGHARSRGREPLPVAGPHGSLGELRELYAGLRRQHALRDLLAAHLEREYDRRLASRDRCCARDVETERRLTDRGSRRDDDHLPALQTAREVIELAEARGHAEERAVVL